MALQHVAPAPRLPFAADKGGAILGLAIDGPDRYAARAARKEVEQATQSRLRSWRRPWTYASAARRLDTAERYERLIRDAAEPGSVQAYLDYVLLAYRGQPVAVDITPNYQCLAAEDYAAMARLHPNARFVFLMRDPVERLWSGVRHALRDRIRSGAATEDEIRARFRDALETPGTAISAGRSTTSRSPSWRRWSRPSAYITCSTSACSSRASSTV